MEALRKAELCSSHRTCGRRALQAPHPNFQKPRCGRCATFTKSFLLPLSRRLPRTPQIRLRAVPTRLSFRSPHELHPTQPHSPLPCVFAASVAILSFSACRRQPPVQPPASNSARFLARTRRLTPSCHSHWHDQTCQQSCSATGTTGTTRRGAPAHQLRAQTAPSPHPSTVRDLFNSVRHNPVHHGELSHEVPPHENAPKKNCKYSLSCQLCHTMSLLHLILCFVRGRPRSFSCSKTQESAQPPADAGKCRSVSHVQDEPRVATNFSLLTALYGAGANQERHSDTPCGQA